MNVFQEVGGSIIGVNAYPELLKNRKMKVFWYGVFIATIFFLIVNVIDIVKIASFIGRFEKEVCDNIPEFTLSNGTLHIDQTYELDESGVYLFIDTDEDFVFWLDETEWKRQLADYEAALIADSQGCVTKSKGEVQLITWPKTMNLTRESIISFRPLLVIGFIIVYMVVWVGGIGGYFLGALFVALAGLVIAAVQKNHFSFGEIYQLSIYAKTLPLLIEGLCRLANLTKFAFVGTLLTWGGFALACVYLGLAMSHIAKERYRPDPYDPYSYQ